ncbi:MAG TPA: hypothetical protein VLA71_00220 [Algoriphagus sp.]|nr:hypothetical protein [Algoriphagus sp.]
MNQDIRWDQRLNNYAKALLQLENAILLSKERRLSDLKKQGLIQGDNISLTELLKIENELDDLLLPYQIDLSILKKIDNSDLLDHIRRVGKVFFEKKKDSSSIF